MAGSTTIRELLVKLGIDAEKGEAGLKSFDEGLDKVKEGMTNLVGYAVKASAAITALGAASLFTAVKTGEHAEQIREQAAALGVTTDAYQELSFIASKYGIDSEKITVILSKLAVDQKAIAEGNKDTTATYAQLGLSVDEVRNAKPAELFAMMADGFGTVTDASTRLAIGSELFGDRIASKLLPLLATGSAGLDRVANEVGHPLLDLVEPLVEALEPSFALLGVNAEFDEQLADGGGASHLRALGFWLAFIMQVEHHLGVEQVAERPALAHVGEAVGDVRAEHDAPHPPVYPVAGRGVVDGSFRSPVGLGRGGPLDHIPGSDKKRLALTTSHSAESSSP